MNKIVYFIFSVVAAQTYNVQFVNSPATCPVETPVSSANAIMNRGFLGCGTAETDNIFGKLSGTQGDREGFDVTLCKAVAAAIFPDYTFPRVKYTTVDGTTRFSLIQSKSVDMVARGTTKNALRAATYKFAPVMLYDGTTIAAKKTNTVAALSDIPNGATVCTAKATTTEKAVATWGQNKGIVVSATFEQAAVYEAFANGQCAYIAGDLTALTSNINSSTDRILTGNPFSKEPLAPFANVGETQFGQILEAVMNGLILAEERGVTKSTASATNDVYPAELGAKLGLSAFFMTNVIKNVGNYGEIYAQFVNTSIPRAGGMNRLSKDGGLLYPTD